MVNVFISTLFSEDSLCKYLNYSILLLVAVLPFSVALTNIVSGIVLFIYILIIIKNPSIIKAKFIFKLPLILFIIFKILSVIFSINFGKSAEILYKVLPFYLLVFVFYYGLKNNFSFYLMMISRIILVTSLISSIMGMGTFFLNISERAASIGYGYTSLGIFLTASLTYLIFLKDNKDVFKKTYYWYISIIIILSGVLFTFNRVHWVAIFLLLIFYSVYTKKYIPLAVLGLIFALALFVFPEFKIRLMQLVFLLSNMSDRDTLWKGAYKIILDRPVLGFGPNTFSDIFMYKDLMGDKFVSSWHNDYLQVYMESGIFTVGILIYIVILILVNLIKYFQNAKTEANYFLSVSMCLMFFVIFGGTFDILGGFLFKLFLSIFSIYITFLSNKYNIQKNGQRKII